MPVVVESRAASPQRPLPLRCRPDLTIREQSCRGTTSWLVKDPVTLKYYRLEHEELALLRMLDGHTSLEDLQHRFAATFPPQQITLAELHRLLGLFWRASLVISDSPGQGPVMLARQRQRRGEERRAPWANPLAIRFRGIDPDRLLTRMASHVGWYFSRWSAGTVGVLLLVAVVMVGARFEEVLRRLPDFQTFLSTRNWWLFAAVLSVTKVLHEFGHGIACKRFGGECHDMGVMLLVFTPCLYCDVSDSWTLPNKWQRLAIGAAGIYVELCLATIATFLWLAANPGWFQDACLLVMLTCSVSTLLFNANPLMRYDGYYMLSDLVEVPNLRQKASRAVRGWLATWLWGSSAGEERRSADEPRWLPVYAVAAWGYSWMVTIAIGWFLYGLLEPHGGKALGQLLVVGMLGGSVVWGVRSWFTFFQVPGRFDRMNKLRFSLIVGVVMLLAGTILWIPVPYRIYCPLQVAARDAATVYVDVPGELAEVFVRYEEPVRAGQPLLRLKNGDLEETIAELENQRERQIARLKYLRQSAAARQVTEGDIRATEQAIAGLEARLAEYHLEQARLTIRAPRDGKVLPPPHRPPSRTPGRLASWDGTPFEPRNRQAWLTEATLICRIGDPVRLEAILAIEQQVADDVRPGQSVELMLEQAPGRRIRGAVQQVAKIDMELAPDALAQRAGGDVATQRDSAGQERLATAHYQANVAFDAGQGDLFLNGRGQAKIHAGYRPLARRLWIWLCRTFEIDT